MTMWIKAGRCVGGDCVEVRLNGNLVEVRDSKLGDDSPVLTFDERAWRLTLSAITQFASSPGMFTGPDGVTWQRDGAELRFTWAEFDRFVAGVKDGGFDVDRLAASDSDELDADARRESPCVAASDRNPYYPDPSNHATSGALKFAEVSDMPRPSEGTGGPGAH